MTNNIDPFTVQSFFIQSGSDSPTLCIVDGL